MATEETPKVGLEITEAVIYELGMGFPTPGDHIQGEDHRIYRVLEMGGTFTSRWGDSTASDLAEDLNTVIQHANLDLEFLAEDCAVPGISVISINDKDYLVDTEKAMGLLHAIPGYATKSAIIKALSKARSHRSPSDEAQEQDAPYA